MTEIAKWATTVAHVLLDFPPEAWSCCETQSRGDAPMDVDRMHGAWMKTVLLQVILWSHPYVKDGQF